MFKSDWGKWNFEEFLCKTADSYEKTFKLPQP